MIISASCKVVSIFFSPLILLVSAFAALIANGGAPRASIFMGKGDTESAERTLGNCFVTQIIISVVLTAVLLIFDEQFLWLFGASENTIMLIKHFLSRVGE